MKALIIVLVILGIVGFSIINSRQTPDQTVSQPQDIPTSADNAPPGAIHNLPVPEAVAAVRTLVANELGISEGVVIIMTAFEKEWPNSCLGLEGKDEFCAQVITPGYEVTVQAQGTLRAYRTNESGSIIRREK
ncbi:hypothetical protein COB64_00325 [Candidatus Wolfebacteria bacterium]|nr:MAG: hypothetical protein COB64_00325 [Candidatus Wolfebacteria bacterium]